MALTKRTAGLPLICLVCGDVARGINFDLMTCMSCKAFFRRHAAKPLVSTHLFTDDWLIFLSISTAPTPLPTRWPLRDRSTHSRCLFSMSTGEVSSTRNEPHSHPKLCANNAPDEASSCFTSERTSSSSGRTVDTRVIISLMIVCLYRQPQALNLLRQDQSTLTSEEWTLLSNIIHAYDTSNIIPQTRALFQQQGALPPKLRAKPSTTFHIIKYFYSFIQPLLERSPLFHQLPIDARRSLIRNNTEMFGAFSCTFILREINALGNASFVSGCSAAYGFEVMNRANRFLDRMEQNGSLVKIMLFICAFYGSCSIVRFNGVQSSTTASDHLTLSHIQNMLVTMLWKYLTYQYGPIHAIRCFSSLVTFLLDLIKYIDQRSTAEHLKMVDVLIQESTRLLVIEDDSDVQ